MLLVIHLIVMLSFIALGIVFMNGKGAFLIAGYNTLPKDKKSKFDNNKLCRFMGKFMFVLAACWVAVLLSDILKIMALLWIGLILFLIVIICGVIYANTGNRFS